MCIRDRYNGSSISEDNYATIEFSNDNSFRIGYAFAAYIKTNRLFRDIGWYHIVSVIDTTQSTASDRVRMYVNGVQETSFSATHNPDENEDLAWNKASFIHRLGSEYNQQFSTFNITQVNFIDGQALGPESFGYTDGLTNTWRLKKYEGTFGTNGFYLPLDGSAPIGEDKSGQGNNWTPVNFGGSVSLDNSIVSGARPILNTLPGGTTATPGVFGSKENQFVTVTVASKTGGGNAYFFGGVERDSLASLRGTTVTFNTTDSTNNSHPFKLSSTNADSSGGTEYTDGVAYYINGSVVSGSDYVTNYSSGAASGFRGIKWTVPHNQSTTYYYCTIHTGMGNNGAFTSTIDETKADPYAWKCVIALPLVGNANDVSNSVNSGSVTKATTVSGAVANYAFSNFYGGSYYFDGSNDNVVVADSTDYDFGTADFTTEVWFYATSISGDQYIMSFTGGAANAGHNGINIYNSNWRIGGFNNYLIEGNVGLVANKWIHVAISRESGTLRVFVDGSKIGETSANVSFDSTSAIFFGSYAGSSLYYGPGYMQDARVYRGVAKYTSNFIPASTNPDILPDTPSGVSGGSKLTKITDGAVVFDGTTDDINVPSHSDITFGTGVFTIDCFVYFNSFDDTYPTIMSKYTNSISWILRAKNTGKIVWYTTNGGGTNNESSTSPILLKKWHHIAVVREGTGSNQLKVYVDGTVAITMTDANDYNDSNVLCIGAQQAGGGNTINGYISNVRLVKGTALYTTNFTPPTRTLTNVTNTKLLCCQSPTSATAASVIPTGSITANGNAAATNFNPLTTDINTVRGQETGYATLNPLVLSGGATISNGNLDILGSSPYRTTPSTIGIKSGKYYWEYFLKYFDGGSTDCHLGICLDNFTQFRDTWVLSTNYGWGYVCQVGQGYHGNSATNIGSSGRTTGDTIAFSLDADVGELYIYVNGIIMNSGVPVFTGLTNGPYYPFVSTGSNASNVSCNFGQKPFKFPPPAGFQSLNAASVRPETVIARPDQYVAVTTYSGTGNARLVNVGLEPDFVWIKQRNGTRDHVIYDTVRGTTKELFPSGTGQENTLTGGLTSFNDDGFTVGSSSRANENSKTFVCWNLKAGGNKNTFNVDDIGYASAAAAGLTGGSLTVTGASVGTRQGFSIIKYAGANNGSAQTIPHGLSQKPDFMIVKQLTDNSTGWTIYHSAIGATKYFGFDSGSADDNAGPWNDTEPTSSVFTVGSGYNNVNRASRNFVAYLWHDVPGMFKTGTYKNNASADGPFIELGFKPAIVLIKCTSSGTNWRLADNVRNPINDGSGTKWLKPSTTDIEADERAVDFVSNGIKIRSTAGGDINQSSNAGTITYAYAAWAEAPTFNLYGAQSNAR